MMDKKLEKMEKEQFKLLHAKRILEEVVLSSETFDDESLKKSASESLLNIINSVQQIAINANISDVIEADLGGRQP